MNSKIQPSGKIFFFPNAENRHQTPCRMSTPPLISASATNIDAQLGTALEIIYLWRFKALEQQSNFTRKKNATSHTHKHISKNCKFIETRQPRKNGSRNLNKINNKIAHENKKYKTVNIDSHRSSAKTRYNKPTKTTIKQTNNKQQQTSMFSILHARCMHWTELINKLTTNLSVSLSVAGPERKQKSWMHQGKHLPIALWIEKSH